MSNLDVETKNRYKIVCNNIIKRNELTYNSYEELRNSRINQNIPDEIEYVNLIDHFTNLGKRIAEGHLTTVPCIFNDYKPCSYKG